jgi:hypothetical protein
MAQHDLAPLVEKLQTSEKLSVDDFTAIFNMVKDAMADGRLSIMEGIRIGLAIFKLIGEITSGSSTDDVDFGFERR